MYGPLSPLDVDGVLRPWLRPECGTWLMALASRADLVWASAGWQHDANHHIGPVIGLPELPVIEFPALEKLGPVADWCGKRPLAWLDDGFTEMHHDWAFRRNLDGLPTLLIPVDAGMGLQEQHCAAVSWWLDDLAAA